ncbi:chloramphenicol acetyltransferase [Soonwooa sp.]|uniref:chloramphenicol acetyltransferase n=1 Tax=Soonwooa sp. TaxID=1938592 RepID=UPI00262BC1A4|nr:chloramphenicol acetyltransferase [Soonwooa sp.]
MQQIIDIETWIRKDHFRFFTQFEEPFFGVTITMDFTKAYENAKKNNKSLFLHYLYRALKAANQVENFRYRIVDNQVVLFDVINASPTINRENGTFGFSYFDFDEDEQVFIEKAKQEIEKVQNETSLIPAVSGENIIHFSSLPWLNFTSLSHARSFSFPDSAPKISFGKIYDEGDSKKMSVSIHVHHALMDGLHVSQFVDAFQKLLDEEV